MATPVMQKIPARIQQAAAKRRNRTRSLPDMGHRRTISVNITSSLDTQLEILTVLDKKMKNQVVNDSLREFLTNANSFSLVSEYPSSESKVRVTFVLPTELDDNLTTFTKSHGCSAASTVTAALSCYLKRQNLRERVIQALHL